MAKGYALDALGKHDEGKVAAQNASQRASSTDERAKAAELAYTADTELTVQFTGMPTAMRRWSPHACRGMNDIGTRL